MNRYEIEFNDYSIGSVSTVIVFAESFVLAVYVFVDNRYGKPQDIISISKKDKVV